MYSMEVEDIAKSHSSWKAQAAGLQAQLVQRDKEIDKLVWPCMRLALSMQVLQLVCGGEAALFSSSSCVAAAVSGGRQVGAVPDTP